MNFIPTLPTQRKKKINNLYFGTKHECVELTISSSILKSKYFRQHVDPIEQTRFAKKKNRFSMIIGDRTWLTRSFKFVSDAYWVKHYWKSEQDSYQFLLFLNVSLLRFPWRKLWMIRDRVSFVSLCTTYLHHDIASLLRDRNNENTSRIRETIWKR